MQTKSHNLHLSCTIAVCAASGNVSHLAGRHGLKLEFIYILFFFKLTNNSCLCFLFFANKTSYKNTKRHFLHGSCMYSNLLYIDYKTCSLQLRRSLIVTVTLLWGI